jgi:hypothetical protein
MRPDGPGDGDGAGDGRVTLSFGDADPKVVRNLSAAVVQGNSLFLGSDEGVTIEHLSRRGAGWGDHRAIDLADLLPIDAEEEADIEGLAADAGWLWVVGSHARCRPKVDPDGDGLMDTRALAELKDTRPRCLLARLPLAGEGPDVLPVAQDGKRRAGMLKLGGKGNALAKALRADPLLAPFTIIPSKEGGIDIEGIAAAGSRVALGLRGPVIRGYALLLDLELSAKKSGALKLERFAKRLLDLDGLGIRDLKRLDDDLLILAGPTAGLDGPCRVHRWRNWLGEPPQHVDRLAVHAPELVMELEVGRGCDHPEGLALLPGDGVGARLLLVCDRPSDARLDAATGDLSCAVVTLPD